MGACVFHLPAGNRPYLTPAAPPLGRTRRRVGIEVHRHWNAGIPRTSPNVTNCVGLQGHPTSELNRATWHPVDRALASAAACSIHPRPVYRPGRSLTPVRGHGGHPFGDMVDTQS